ncbi:PucR family transcriptional regulator [Pseudonocardia spinosispora]|uniref:PucR family transcriptional regulator n=1 Tax=Pseudonocardia spinosispora TaxID=103441 RepID=UPI00040A3D79|nr:PucR family transcriptional regulator [Pseudonocardia spinosispora]
MITVDELVSVASLELGYYAGSSGGGRPITWAHTCDMPDPWTWVGAGDLVMTTGGGIPAEPADQVEWLVELARTRASGILIGPRPGTPAISAQMCRAADELRFPLIDADFELEFAGVAHVVIESVLRAERDRIVEIRRLYDAYGQALRSRVDLAERLRLVAQNLGWALELRDRRSGRTLASSGRTSTSRSGTESVPVPGTSPAELIAAPGRRPRLDTLVLHHLAGLIGVELEQRAAERDQLRDTGAQLFDDLLDGRLQLAAVRAELTRRGLTAPLCVARFAAAGSDDQLQHSTAFDERHPLLSHRDGGLVALLPSDARLLDELLAELGGATRVGVSRPLTDALDVPEAARQARVALAHATPSRRRTGYAELSGLPPRSVAEATELVDRYLGPIIEHDEANGTALVETLRTFLGNDGAWQVSAAALGIHRQTLVYRLGTVRRLTGLKPTSSEGTAKLWLALEAGTRAGLLGRRRPAQSEPPPETKLR